MLPQTRTKITKEKFGCSQSEKLSTSLYKTDWVGCTQAYQKKVLFVMMHMQRVIIIRVGNLIDLSLDNLVAVGELLNIECLLFNSVLGVSNILVLFFGIAQYERLSYETIIGIVYFAFINCD